MKHKRDQSAQNVRTDQEFFCAQGVSRRIVVVPADENELYEKVIYVVRDEAASRGVTAQEVLREAKSCLVPETADPFTTQEIDETEQHQDAERVSRILFALSGVALALSGGALVYWFFAI